MTSYQLRVVERNWNPLEKKTRSLTLMTAPIPTSELPMVLALGQQLKVKHAGSPWPLQAKYHPITGAPIREAKKV
ncbi:MAG: hypothetical protein JRN37_04105 [Nitrososphaerota archaeon]|jgi:uncharacterized protein YaaN involved in tellurite resistance|nr:hypothetical protein [Nitrososphaerota archaeon]